MAGKEKKGWILIVEDTVDLSEVIEERLVNEGYQVQKATTSSEAITRLSRQQFECVFLDMQLARGTNGIEVVDYIRRDEKAFNFRTPVIVISQHLDRDDIKEIAKKINRIVVKPFKLSDLMKTLEDVKQKAAS